MTESYNPLNHSIVQATTGTWCEYECDPYVEALLDALLDEIRRVHWNVYQHQWGPSWHYDEIEDPEIPGILFTRYYDGCPCEDEPEHRPDCRHARPNFQFEDVQFRWYKYPGRGMSTTKEWNAEQWRTWFMRCRDKIREFDDSKMEDSDLWHERNERLRAALQARFPKAFNVKMADAEIEAHRRLFDAFDRVEEAQTPCWACSEKGFGAGGGTFEGGEYGTVARTLHEDDDPDGPCRNCGHVNTDEQKAMLDERRRKNSDAGREQWARMTAEDKKWEAERTERRERAELARLKAKYESAPAADAVDPHAGGSPE